MAIIIIIIIEGINNYLYFNSTLMICSNSFEYILSCSVTPVFLFLFRKKLCYSIYQYHFYIWIEAAV